MYVSPHGKADVWVSRNRAMDSVVISVLLGKTEDGKVNALTFSEKTFEPYTQIPDDCSLSLNYQLAQKLVDELWDAGLRPTQGEGSAGSLLATQNHLKDMQSISNRLLIMIEKKEA